MSLNSTMPLAFFTFALGCAAPAPLAKSPALGRNEPIADGRPELEPAVRKARERIADAEQTIVFLEN